MSDWPKSGMTLTIDEELVAEELIHELQDRWESLLSKSDEHIRRAVERGYRRPRPENFAPDTYTIEFGPNKITLKKGQGGSLRPTTARTCSGSTRVRSRSSTTRTCRRPWSASGSTWCSMTSPVSETTERELARRIRVLLIRAGKTTSGNNKGFTLYAGTGNLFVMLTTARMAVYYEGQCVYTEDGTGHVTGLKVPDVGHAVRELRKAQVLDDLASI